MRERFKEFLVERCGVRKGDAIIVGVSGGADSTALAHLLVQLQPELALRLVIVAVDHGLRPESSSEISAVDDLSRALGTTMYTTSVRTQERALVDKISIEEAARLERHEALEQFRVKLQATWIALGHTASDQAETVLQRLRRGTGIDGLACMIPRRENIIRPLLWTSREDVRSYLEGKGQGWCEDPSNNDPIYERSRLRAQILPLVNEARATELASIAAEIKDNLGRGERAWLYRYGVALEKAAFLEDAGYHTLEDPIRARILRRVTSATSEGWTAPLSRRATQDVVALTRGEAGHELSLHRAKAWKVGGPIGGFIYGAVLPKPRSEGIMIDGPGTYRHEPLMMTVVVSETGQSSPLWGRIDFGSPFIVRRRMFGDRLATQGKKMKGQWQEIGLWPHLRDWVPVVVRDRIVEWTANTTRRDGEGGVVSFLLDETNPLREWFRLVRGAGGRLS